MEIGPSFSFEYLPNNNLNVNFSFLNLIRFYKHWIDATVNQRLLTRND